MLILDVTAISVNVGCSFMHSNLLCNDMFLILCAKCYLPITRDCVPTVNFLLAACVCLYDYMTLAIVIKPMIHSNKFVVNRFGSEKRASAQ